MNSESSTRRSPARLGILLSGRGSNFLALQAAIERREIPAEIVVVLSNQTDAPGLERARQAGIEAVAISHKGLRRAEHEARVLEVLKASRVEWVCLAGYMRLLGADFVRAYPERILNIHPSLLPAFPGLDAQGQALCHGVRVAGCTVHLVDAELDNGPIVVQRAVPVHDHDTPRTLAARILEQEHEAYPEALRRLLTEPWRVEGRRLAFRAQGDLRAT